MYSNTLPWGVQTVLPMTVYMKGEINMLSDRDKSNIAEMRMQGHGFTAIARELSLKASTVRMYCVRNQLTDEDIESRTVCVRCGSIISKKSRTCKNPFCSEKCRSAWRRSTGKLSEKTYHHTCIGCGASFDTIGNKNQLYCSLRCYHDHRKGGVA